ncbi:MAG: hypothetical protein AAFP70_21125, partial [Calditrichota bacterium]
MRLYCWPSEAEARSPIPKENMPPEQLNKLFADVKQKLLSANRSFYLLKTGTAFFWLLFGCASLFLTYTLVGTLIDFPVLLRLSFWLICACALTYVGYRYLFPWLQKALSPAERDLYETSRMIGRENTSVSDALVNFLQIYNDRRIKSPDAFKDRSLQQLHGQFAGSDFNTILSG